MILLMVMIINGWKADGEVGIHRMLKYPWHIIYSSQGGKWSLAKEWSAYDYLNSLINHKITKSRKIRQCKHSDGFRRERMNGTVLLFPNRLPSGRPKGELNLSAQAKRILKISGFPILTSKGTTPHSAVSSRQTVILPKRLIPATESDFSVRSRGKRFVRSLFHRTTIFRA